MINTKYELVIVGAGVVGMGVALAARKKGVKKILIVDLDPQGNASTGLGIDEKRREKNIHFLKFDFK